MMYGVKRCGPEITSVINNIGPFITMTFGYILLSESIEVFDMLGMIIVIISILCINKENLNKGDS